MFFPPCPYFVPDVSDQDTYNFLERCRTKIDVLLLDLPATPDIRHYITWHN